MGQNFIACDREQAFLMPPDVREWLPESHLAWFVLDAVKELDLAAFYSAYRADGHGRAAYEPAMMVALFLYAYARGVRSSRAIERACEEDVAYRVIAAQQRPDHATLARFVERHEAALAGCSARCSGFARGPVSPGSGWSRSTARRCSPTPAATPTLTTSRSRARSSPKRKLSTPPKTRPTARRAATSCRPS